MAIALRLILVLSLIALVWLVLQYYLAWANGREEWQLLLNICHGDRGRARRLMRYEKDAAPGISDAEACRRAIDRYYRDNR